MSNMLLTLLDKAGVPDVNSWATAPEKSN